MIVGVLLAAGAGTRFGGGKLLHKLADGTPIAVAAAASLLPACDHVIAVIRAGDEELATLLTQAGCSIVVCNKAELGMGHSLAAGVQASADASATHRAVAACLRSGASLAASQYRGKRGHPVGFSSAWQLPLMALTGDQGARALLGAHSDSVTHCAVDDPGVLRDIDRREDLKPLVETLYTNL
jgi:molybdenum cofactor cytidylyltransferase